MKKVLLLSVLLSSVVVSGFASLPVPQRELSLGQTILADNYAFHFFPSLLPQEDSQLWMTFAGGNFANVAIFCKKSELFNLFLIHDNFVQPVTVVNNLFTTASGASPSFGYTENYHSPLNFGYALSLGMMSLGILVDYQYYNEKANFYGANTNILDVNNTVLDIRPGLSVDLGALKIDASLPVRLNSLKYVDTLDNSTTTNNIQMRIPFLNNLGLTVRAHSEINETWSLGAWINASAETFNNEYEDNTAGIESITAVWDAVTFVYSATAGFSCTPSEKISIYGDVTYGQSIANAGKNALYIDGARSGAVTTNNVVTTSTLAPTMNFGIEINLGKFTPRFGIQNSYTQVKTYNEVSKNMVLQQPASAQTLTAGFGLVLGDFTIDGTLAAGANTLLAAINNPFMIPATVIGNPSAANTIDNVFASVEVNYRF